MPGLSWDLARFYPTKAPKGCRWDFPQSEWRRDAGLAGVLLQSQGLEREGERELSATLLLRSTTTASARSAPGSNDTAQLNLPARWYPCGTGPQTTDMTRT